MTTLPVAATTITGDRVSPGEDRQVVVVTVGGVTVTVYESLMERGRVVIDVDAEEDDHQAERVAIAVHDVYVHGGPAVSA